MDEKLKKLMKSKGEKKMHPVEKEAKMASLKELHSMAKNMLGDRLHGLKKVSVMADDKEGLEEGLSKAKSLLDGKLEDGGVSDTSPEMADKLAKETLETPEEEAEESPEEQAMEAAEGTEMHHPDMEEMDEDSIEQKIQHLMEMKKRLAKK